MNFSGLGGITLVVVTCLWIFVFIPSWFNSANERTTEKNQVREVKRAIAAARQPIMKTSSSKVASLSDQVYRVHRAGKAAAIASTFFLLTSVSLFVVAQNFAIAWAGAFVSSALAIASMRFWVLTRAKAKRLLVASIRSRAASAVSASATNARAKAQALADLRANQQAQKAAEILAKEQAAAAEALRRSKEFTAEPLPAPTYATQTGSLEAPEFAEIVDLADKKVDSETITEILRQRRQSSA